MWYVLVDNYLHIFWLPDHLSGVKVLHGLEKVAEGGAVILTLKDQSVLADGDVNNGSYLLMLSFITVSNLVDVKVCH